LRLKIRIFALAKELDIDSKLLISVAPRGYLRRVSPAPE